MADFEICKALSDAFGPSGYEHDVAEVVMQHMQPFAPQRDSMQNVYTALPKNTGKRPLVMLDAHMDEVGFMLQSITAGGLLKVVPLGGWVEHNIPAHIFYIRNTAGELVKAVSASKPPHFMSEAERKAPLNMDSILLDAGVTCRNDAVELLHLEPGLPVMPDVECTYNDKTDLLLGKAFDCRLGCAAIIEIMHRLQNEPLNVDVAGVFSTQEEVGLRGAKVTAERMRPALAICMEGTPADDMFTPECEAQGVLKKGVQIRFRDGSMVANPAWVAYARKTAEANGILHQCAVRTGGGTNGGSIHVAPGGVPTLVLGVPVRYAHTHYGYAAMRDVDSAVDLAVAIIKSLTQEDVAALSPAIL